MQTSTSAVQWQGDIQAVIRDRTLDFRVRLNLRYDAGLENGFDAGIDLAYPSQVADLGVRQCRESRTATIR